MESEVADGLVSDLRLEIMDWGRCPVVLPTRSVLRVTTIDPFPSGDMALLVSERSDATLSEATTRSVAATLSDTVRSAATRSVIVRSDATARSVAATSSVTEERSEDVRSDVVDARLETDLSDAEVDMPIRTLVLPESFYKNFTTF